MDRIELADVGGWIELRDPEDLSEADRQNIALIGAETPRTSALRVHLAITNAIKVVLIAGWHIPYLPESEKLPADDPDLLLQLKPRHARLLDPYAEKTYKALWPGPASVDDYDDESSPTEPANA